MLDYNTYIFPRNIWYAKFRRPRECLVLQLNSAKEKHNEKLENISDIPVITLNILASKYFPY